MFITPHLLIIVHIIIDIVLYSAFQLFEMYFLIFIKMYNIHNIKTEMALENLYEKEQSRDFPTSPLALLISLLILLPDLVVVTNIDLNKNGSLLPQSYSFRH